MIVKKKKGKIVEAYCLGQKNRVVKELIERGYILEKEEGVFEIFSQEAVNGKGEKATAGDYIKIDSQGRPYPNSKEFFERNHRKIGENLYEQIQTPLFAWEVNEDKSEEIEYLLQTGKLVINEQQEEKYFEAFLWGAMLSASKDTIIIFYEIEKNNSGQIINVDFNFVKREEFNKTYDIINLVS